MEEIGGPGIPAVAWFLPALFTHIYNVDCEQKAEQSGESVVWSEKLL